jgi:hypothetical protein
MLFSDVQYTRTRYTMAILLWLLHTPTTTTTAAAAAAKWTIWCSAGSQSKQSRHIDTHDGCGASASGVRLLVRDCKRVVVYICP